MSINANCFVGFDGIQILHTENIVFVILLVVVYSLHWNIAFGMHAVLHAYITVSS